MKRYDIVAKSTGTLPYGIDFELDGMLYATVKTNPRKGAMNSFDASKAEKMRGVSKIVPLQNGVGVIADNTWRAFQAAEAILFDWAQAPYPAQMDDHWQALEASFSEEQLDARTRDEGDVVSALVGAGVNVIETEYRAPYVAHQPLEPLGAVARVTTDRIDIWTCTQSPGFARTSVAKQTGMDESKIFLHVLYGGGSFGHRLETQVINQAVTLAQAVSGTPVKLTYRREEDFAQDFPRQIAMARAKGTVKNGQVETLDLSIAMPSVMSSQLGRLGFSLPGPDASDCRRRLGSTLRYPQLPRIRLPRTRIGAHQFMARRWCLNEWFFPRLRARRTYPCGGRRPLGRTHPLDVARAITQGLGSSGRDVRLGQPHGRKSRSRRCLLPILWRSCCRSGGSNEHTLKA
ncbi:MAG: xanthine dehydrogenase family protein [Ahrensia sp.]|nr:xanthine dehydrogenase family protein [Ahrensia sp.]